jgi:predicted ATPase/class 3 adenylate cyclase
MIESRSGTVTLLFADIAGSTRMLGELGDAYGGVLREYRRLVEDAAVAEHGSLLDTAGDGVFYSFPSARGALSAALTAQRSLRDHPWPANTRVEARIGIHTGEPLSSDESLVGMDVHRAARICAAGHGGQILLSMTTHDLLRGTPLPDANLRDLGEHRLKDLPHPERLYQATASDLPSEFPALRSLDNWPNNLPRQLSSFVGRVAPLDDVRARLAETFLLTLVGPAGVGKTRLACEVALQSIDQFPDGAWVVELGALTDGALLAETVASTMRIKEQPGTPLLQTLADHLETRRLLLVFDDCEHLLDATAEVIGPLLQAGGDSRILVTSREPLAIPGERLYPVPTLELPAPEGATVDDAADTEAVRLFVDRAVAVQPTFALTAENTAAVIQICRRLDGIPLAIELAAARVKALPPEQIASRLDDRFRLLTGGSRMALPRHRTLKAALDWSFDLLTDAERALLIRLSVFAGGFSLDAIEEVCGGDVVETGDVLDLVTRLIDRSLVVAETSADEARYRLLDSVQQYAAELLAADDPDGTTNGRHQAFVVGLVERLGAAMLAGGPPGADPPFPQLVKERENVRAALQRADDDPSAAAEEQRLAANLGRYWEIGGLLVEGRSWLARALARTDGEVSDLRANALTSLGTLAIQQGDLAAATTAHEEALATQRQLDNPNAVAYAASNLANTWVERGELDRARELYEEALAILAALDDPRASALAKLNLADVADRQGHQDEARRLVDESVETFRAERDPIGIALSQGRGATFSLRHGDRADARRRHDEALEIYRMFGDGRGVARTLMFIGDIVALDGDMEEAERLYREAIEQRWALGDRSGLATACDRLARASAIADPERSARLIGFADAQRDAIGASLPSQDAAERDELIGSLDGRLGTDEFGGLRHAGRRLPLVTVLLSSPAPAGGSGA